MKTRIIVCLISVFVCLISGGTRAAEIAMLSGGYMEVAEDALERLGLSYTVLDSVDVELARLTGYGIALVPYDFALSDAGMREIEKFALDGGKLICFYTLRGRLADLLGLRYMRHLVQEYEGQFTSIRFDRNALRGAPERVFQNSWNISVVEPSSQDTEVLARWYDERGKSNGYPALTLSPNGAYMSHILLRDDPEGKQRMLLALLAHLLPDVWRGAATSAISHIGRVGDLSDIEELEAWVEASPNARDARKRLAAVRKGEKEARARVESSGYPEAVELAMKARGRAAEAYATAQSSKGSEFRGVWIHVAYGVADWGWKRSIMTLRKNGFNAILPNVLWAGLAHYESEILPVSDRTREQGDPLAECVKWGRKYGVEVHPWKVNYNLSTAPEEFVAQLRAKGRLQRDRYGNELKWLCPSHPENFRLERDSMLEVVRKYDVDGIHFDYIRYPHENSCYCEGCRDRFQQDTGIEVTRWPEDVLAGDQVEAFQQWRQDQITGLVCAVSEEVRRIKPYVKISAAVFSNWSRDRYAVGQDWKFWIERGYLDFVCPMDYTPSIKGLEEIVARQVNWVGGRIPLCIGIGAYRLTSADQVIDRIARTRALGADGFVLFQYDADLGRSVLPMLHRGLTREHAVMPYRAPEVTFELPEGAPELEGYAYPEGTDLSARVVLRPEGRLRHPIRSAEGMIELIALDGQRVATFGRLAKGGERSKALRFRLNAGGHRLAIRGRMRVEGEGKHLFTVRSPILRVLSPAALEAERARYGAPKVAGEGLRIGIYREGYGSTGISAALKSVGDFLPFFVWNFLRPTLDICEVLILPQPKEMMAVGKGDQDALREWVASGGGLLVTHDMVGYRWMGPIFPEICRGGATHVDRTTWVAAKAHPVTEGVQLGRIFTHSYYDRIVLEPGGNGEILITDPEDGTSILMVGSFGEGRYVANGMCAGLDVDDTDVEPEGPERTVLINAVRWLGGY